MLPRGAEVDMEPYYCLPVGSAHNGNLLSAKIVATADNCQVSAAHSPVTGGTAVVWSQPTSPTPIPLNNSYGISLSPTHQTISNMNNNLANNHKLSYPKKNDEGEQFILYPSKIIFKFFYSVKVFIYIFIYLFCKL